MPNWLVISAADLTDHKVAELVDALRNEALGSGQADPTPGIIVEVSAEIRGAIGFSGRYLVDANLAAIPASLREAAANKIIRVLKGRLEIPLTADEQSDAKIYESRLQALVNHAWPVEQPDIVLNPPVTQTAAITPRITPRDRFYDRTSGDGF